jgi:hypothetical protein
MVQVSAHLHRIRGTQSAAAPGGQTRHALRCEAGPRLGSLFVEENPFEEALRDKSLDIIAGMEVAWHRKDFAFRRSATIQMSQLTQLGNQHRRAGSTFQSNRPFVRCTERFTKAVPGI